MGMLLLTSQNMWVNRGFHVAFKAERVDDIKEWHTKCLALGGKDNGASGPRPEYHPGY